MHEPETNMKTIFSLLFALATVGASAGEGQPATWSTNANGDVTLHAHRRLERPDGTFSAPCWTYTRTPEVGAVFWCTNSHRIELPRSLMATDGTYGDQLVCKTNGCGFSSIVKLEGWKR